MTPHATERPAPPYTPEHATMPEAEQRRQTRVREWRAWRDRRRAEDAARRARADALRTERAAALGIVDAESYAVVLTPAYAGGGLVPVPSQRRRSLRAHLTRVTLAAFERLDGDAPQAPASVAPAPPAVPVPGPALGRLLGAACATCGGHCCRNGGDRGYVSADTIRRVVRDEPGLTVGKVVARYLRRVGRTSHDGSCIYHGAAGCTLPREMRSDTCNRYFCGELTQIRRAAEAGQTSRAFFAAPRGRAGEPTTSAFVDASAPAPSA